MTDLRAAAPRATISVPLRRFRKPVHRVWAFVRNQLIGIAHSGRGDACAPFCPGRQIDARDSRRRFISLRQGYR